MVGAALADFGADEAPFASAPWGGARRPMEGLCTPHIITAMDCLSSPGMLVRPPCTAAADWGGTLCSLDSCPVDRPCQAGWSRCGLLFFCLPDLPGVQRNSTNTGRSSSQGRLKYELGKLVTQERGAPPSQNCKCCAYTARGPDVCPSCQALL